MKICIFKPLYFIFLTSGLYKVALVPPPLLLLPLLPLLQPLLPLLALRHVDLEAALAEHALADGASVAVLGGGGHAARAAARRGAADAGRVGVGLLGGALEKYRGKCEIGK